VDRYSSEEVISRTSGQIQGTDKGRSSSERGHRPFTAAVATESLEEASVHDCVSASMRWCIALIAVAAIAFLKGRLSGRAPKPTTSLRAYKFSALTDGANYRRPGMSSAARASHSMVVEVTERTIAYIDAVGRTFWNEPVCKDTDGYGYRLDVVILQTVNVSTRNTSSRETLFQNPLLDLWRIGRPICRNGIVLLVIADDPYAVIFTGAKVRSPLSEFETRGILYRMHILLEHERVAEAINLGVAEIQNLLISSSSVSLGSREVQSILTGIFYFLNFAVMCGLYLRVILPAEADQVEVLRVSGLTLRRLERDRDRARPNRYGSDTCPICLDEFADQSQFRDNSTTASFSRVLINAVREASLPSDRQRTGDALGLGEDINSDDEQNSLSFSRDLYHHSGSPSRTEFEGIPVQEATRSVDADVETAGYARIRTATMHRAVRSYERVAAGAPQPIDQVLRCGHRFHTVCLAESLHHSESDLCPLCRNEVFGSESSSSLGSSILDVLLES
jgi:hypothetical protein